MLEYIHFSAETNQQIIILVLLGMLHSISPKHVWGLYFCYSCVAALLLQLVILPYFLPQYDDGNGLVKGTDQQGFHLIASKLADKIKLEGWSAWELRPQAHGPAGIAAAIYSVTTVKKPLVLIPINAFVHATSGLLLMLLYQRFTNSSYPAFLGSIPFIVFPSSMMWYAQIHKDGYVILGFLLIVYGWVLLSDKKNWNSLRPIIKILLLIIVGVSLIYAMRPYLIRVIQLLSVIVALMIMVATCVYWYQKVITSKSALRAFLGFAMVLGVMFGFLMNNSHVENILDQNKYIDFNADFYRAILDETKDGVEISLRARIVQDMFKENNDGKLVKIWDKTGILPNFIETKLYQVALVRDGFRLGYPDSKSNIDHHVGFRSAWDVLSYLPRALQIATLSPFPKHWAAEGSSKFNTYMRKMTGVETTISYILLSGALFAVYEWRRRLDLWIIIIFAFGLLALNGFTICNVGTLYRMRYGYMLLFAGLGGAWLSMTLLSKKTIHKI